RQLGRDDRPGGRPPPDRSPRLGSIPRRHVRRLAHRSPGVLRPVPPAAVRKGRWGIYEHRCRAFRKRWGSKLLISGILTSGWEVSDAPEGRIQKDEPERRSEA